MRCRSSPPTRRYAVRPSWCYGRPGARLAARNWTGCRSSRPLRPLPLATLAIDHADKARTTLLARHQPTARAYADDRAPGVVLTQWGGPGTALPLAVAIDANGRVCGRRTGLLGTDQLKSWARACSK